MLHYYHNQGEPMKIGSLVKHWRTYQTGVVIAKKLFFGGNCEWDVVWCEGDWGFYSPDRLVEVV